MRSMFRNTGLFAVVGLMLILVFSVLGFDGLWMVGSTTSQDAKDAAKYAAASRSASEGMEFKVHNIINFQKQESNGYNYKLCLEVSAEGNEAFKVETVVHRDTQNKLKLKSWEDADCKKIVPPNSGGGQ